MKSSVTIRLDTKLDKMLKQECRESGERRSDVLRDALKRQLWIRQFRRLRRKLMPYAEAKGIYTDEDVFRIVS